ncbi:hypothetical protein RUM43_003264 [Polyplax serrata]|uniref:Secreted protein n=1 Tax=Polyplax serrata TaxID=468196 RepID=A0AAN8PF59_POLSC
MESSTKLTFVLCTLLVVLTWTGRGACDTIEEKGSTPFLGLGGETLGQVNRYSSSAGNSLNEPDGERFSGTPFRPPCYTDNLTAVYSVRSLHGGTMA